MREKKSRFFSLRQPSVSEFKKQAKRSLKFDEAQTYVGNGVLGSALGTVTGAMIKGGTDKVKKAAAIGSVLGLGAGLGLNKAYRSLPMIKKRKREEEEAIDRLTDLYKRCGRYEDMRFNLNNQVQHCRGAGYSYKKTEKEIMKRDLYKKARKKLYSILMSEDELRLFSMVAGIEGFKEENYLLSKKMNLNLLGSTKPVEVKFNVIDTRGKVTDRQIKAYEKFMNNLPRINQKITSALRNYGRVKVSSVVFDSTQDYILLDTSRNPEEGLAIIFDSKGEIKLVDQDEVL